MGYFVTKHLPVEAASGEGISCRSKTQISYLFRKDNAYAVDKPNVPPPTMMILELGGGGVYMIVELKNKKEREKESMACNKDKETSDGLKVQANGLESLKLANHHFQRTIGFRSFR